MRSPRAFNRIKDWMIPALLSMGALLAVAVVAVVLPLWRPARPAPLGTRESNLALWRSERRAVDEEFRTGTLNASERERALAELTTRAARDVLPGSAAAAPDAPPRPGKKLAVLLAVFVAGAALGLYSLIGDPASLQFAARGEARLPPAADPRVLAMVDSLAEKMRSRPDDGPGWKLLGRSQFVLGRYPAAVEAYARANRLLPRDPQLLADYADALAMSQGGNLNGQPELLVQQALALDPNSLKALELAGTIELARRNPAGAIAYWERLEKLLPADSDDRRQVDGALTALRAQVSGAALASASPAAPGKAASGTGAARSTISGRVDLAPSLASRVALSDTVFVFARSARQDTPGARMPLAVLRFPARELPREFELTDAMAMAPGHTLSSAASVIVEARVSKSGNAQPASGDLIGASPALAPGASGVGVLIDSTLP